ncbi:MAG: Lrp/AsnC family transcriptional regulator [Actinobacteria bacterium]|nr:Lrp/AsnC family transcriptional regulator [Actinomycetota bacterium]
MSDQHNDTAALLAALADGLPLVLRPYAELGVRAGLSESETLSAMRELRDTRAIRRVGASFSPAGLGYQAALGALAVPEERADEVAAMLEALPNVTHVFELEDRYRLWYVLVAPSRTRLEIAESEMARMAGVADRYRVLPDELFKVTAAFDADGAPDPGEASVAAGARPFDRDERALVRLLQGDMPHTERPYAALAQTLAECGYDVDERWALEQTQELHESGAISSVVATFRRREEPWRAALTIWRCPDEPEAAGTMIASFSEVVHCFERRVPGGMAILAVIEGESRSEIDRAIERIRIAGGLDAPRISYPVREHARAPMRYFTEGD